ncbi:MAG: response regulator [Magnetococcales bacterium]|nr:response regulator [Magnetococcales bacterium]
MRFVSTPPPLSIPTTTYEEIRTRFDRLTPKQRAVCLLMVGGTMSKNIADRLGMSINTVKTHRNEIFRKMGASSLLDLVRQIDHLRTTSDTEESASPALILPGTNEEGAADSRPLRVIVVEDHAALREAIVTGLATLGYQARGVEDGAALDRELVLAPADIVVLDIGLGRYRENGFSIAARLRRQVRCGIVMVTARGELDARIRGLEEGADAYLVKPIDFAELSAVMNSIMRRIKPVSPVA